METVAELGMKTPPCRSAHELLSPGSVWLVVVLPALGWGSASALSASHLSDWHSGLHLGILCTLTHPPCLNFHPWILSWNQFCIWKLRVLSMYWKEDELGVRGPGEPGWGSEPLIQWREPPGALKAVLQVFASATLSFASLSVNRAESRGGKNKGDGLYSGG